MRVSLASAAPWSHRASSDRGPSDPAPHERITSRVRDRARRPRYAPTSFNAIHLIQVNLYGPGDNVDPATSHVLPALIRKCVEAVETGAGRIEARRLLDTSRALAEFGFRARTTLQDGLAETISWYRAQGRDVDRRPTGLGIA